MSKRRKQKDEKKARESRGNNPLQVMRTKAEFDQFLKEQEKK